MTALIVAWLLMTLFNLTVTRKVLKAHLSLLMASWWSLCILYGAIWLLESWQNAVVNSRIGVM